MPEQETEGRRAPAALDKLLARAAAAAREAATAILEVYDSAFQVDTKQDDTPVTAADLRASSIITRLLSGGPQDLPLLSEEGAAVPYEVRRRWDCFWLVDPLDGTREFVKRNNEFTVNIALIEAGRPVLGLVYAPVFALLYAGARGFGAWKIEGLAPETRAGAFPSWEDLTARGRRLRPAGAGGGKKRVVLVGSRSHQSKAFLTYVEELRRSEPGAQMFVSGSALKFCYVAEGRATIYPGFGRTMEWDTAAGQAILNQVGKSVRSCAQGRAGEELVYNKKDLRTGPFIAR